MGDRSIVLVTSAKYRGTASKQKNFNADDRRCTQNTQMISCCSTASGHAFDFQAWLAEIQQQA
jgi:hypothetical protein